MKEEDIFVKVINLRHRNDRREESLSELSASGITMGDDVFFDAYSYPDFGALGASLSHANVIAQYLSESLSPYLIVLEDDFEFFNKQELLADLNNIINYSEQWDIFLLAHNYATPIEVVDDNQGLFRVVNSQTASGYIVKRSFAVKLMSVFFESAVGLQYCHQLDATSRETIKHYFCLDILWKKLQTEFRFVTRYPAILKQRASYSDIEKREVNYGV